MFIYQSGSVRVAHGLKSWRGIEPEILPTLIYSRRGIGSICLLIRAQIGYSKALYDPIRPINVHCCPIFLRPLIASW
jgi:hypothetical protein